jgi:hypothetical protein
LILGHVSTVLATSDHSDANNALSSPFQPSLLLTLLTGELERFRESFPPSLTTSTAPLAHLAYWHVRLLLARLNQGAHDPLELLEPARQTAAILASAPAVNPLFPMFSNLAVTTLIGVLQTTDDENVKSSIEDSLRHLIDGTRGTAAHPLALETVERQAPHLLSPPPASAGSNAPSNPPPSAGHNTNAAAQNNAAVAAPPTQQQHQDMSSQSLQHLADLATAGTEALGASTAGASTAGAAGNGTGRRESVSALGGQGVGSTAQAGQAGQGVQQEGGQWDAEIYGKGGGLGF